MIPIHLKAARYEFKAARDDAGVPHVHARSWHEALYALGYLQAMDRPTQLYFARAVSSGQAAERIANKPRLFEMDLFMRRAGLARYLTREVELLPAETLEQIEFYCQGVNDGFLDTGRTLPMWVTGFQPRPWDAEAVLLIGNLLSYAGLSVTEQESKRQLLEIIQLDIGDDRIRELFSPYLDGIDLDPLREIQNTKRLSDDALEVLADLPRLAGSNAWAVSPSRSASGHAMLAGDPHLEVNRLPAIWYEVALNWDDDSKKDGNKNGNKDGNYVMGATLPGCPIMAVGRTPNLAWSVTYLHANTSDFFIEDCRPGGATGWQYRRGESWHDFRLRQETVKRKGAKPVPLDIYENDQGVLTRTPEADSPGKYLSTAWIGDQPGGGCSIGTWIKMMRASGCRDAIEVVRDCPHPALVWVFADGDGHIASQASGWLPVRGKKQSGIVPIPAWDEANHWQGTVPVEKLPSEFDPAIGFVASANEELYRSDGPPLHAHGFPDYRKRRIVERLTELPQATVTDMQELQYDVVSMQARDLLPVLLAHLEDCPLKEQLSNWDHRYDSESIDATLFSNFYRHVLLEIFGHEKGIGWRRMVYLSTRMGFSTLVLTAIDRTLRKVTSTWWETRDKGELIRLAAESAAAEPVQPWSAINWFHFTNRFFSAGRVGRLLGFRSTKIPMRGCHATLFQGHLLATATRESTFAPSYHMVTDLGTDEAWTNLPGGPSENRFSKWYNTDIQRWMDGDYKQLVPGLKEEP